MIRKGVSNIPCIYSRQESRGSTCIISIALTPKVYFIEWQNKNPFICLLYFSKMKLKKIRLDTNLLDIAMHSSFKPYNKCTGCTDYMLAHFFGLQQINLNEQWVFCIFLAVVVANVYILFMNFGIDHSIEAKKQTVKNPWFHNYTN